MPLPLTQHELDEMRCQAPGCAHTDRHCNLTLHARCHPHMAPWATYDAARGVLKLACSAMGCGKPVGEIKVAP
jgi:hypothetical protein